MCDRFEDVFPDEYPKLQTHPKICVITFSNFNSITYYFCNVRWAPKDAQAIAYRSWQDKSKCFYSKDGQNYKRVLY